LGKFENVTSLSTANVMLNCCLPNLVSRSEVPMSDLYKLVQHFKKATKGSKEKTKIPLFLEGLTKEDVQDDKFGLLFNREDILKGEVPSCNGLATARGLAKLGGN